MPARMLKTQLVRIGFLLIFAAFSAAVLVYLNLYNSRVSTLTTAHEALLSTAEEILFEELLSYETSIRLLRFNEVVISNLSKNQPLDVNKLTAAFGKFGSLVDNVMQVRWLDHTGMERVRVDFEGSNIIIRQDSELQNKASRYYFYEAIKANNEDVSLSNIDLNVENRQIVIPFQPTIRIAIRTGISDQTRDGLLVVNFNLSSNLKHLEQLTTQNARLEIANSEGFWILHPDKTKEWGADLDIPDNNVKMWNEGIWQQLISSTSSSGQIESGILVSHRVRNYDRNKNNASNLFFLVISPPTVLNHIRWNSAWPAALFLLFGATMSWLLLRQSFKARASIIVLTTQLQNEKSELLTANINLDEALHRQQLLQDQLVQSRKLASLGLTVAGVSHELNTPIGSAILGLTGLQSQLKELKRDIELGLTQEALMSFITHCEQRVNVIESSLTRSRTVIQGFKRLAYERSTASLSEFLLVTLVDDLLKTIKLPLTDNLVRFEQTIPDDLVIFCEYGLLSQILENLISNSLEHGFQPGQHGKISITAAVMERNQVEITVTDNGNGIAISPALDIYEPFVTSARNSGHIGLGMYLVHKWVTIALRGTIKQETPADGGCRFVIVIPMRAEVTFGDGRSM